MRVSARVRTALRCVAACLGLVSLAACVTQPVEPPPPAPPASAPAPAPAPPASPVVIVVPPQPEPADQVARQVLAYHEQLRQMSAADLGNEITRLNAVVSANAAAAPTGAVVELALALAQQHNGGDVARAVQLLESVVKVGGAPEQQPWQPMARLLLGRIAEQRRLEDLFNREAAQRRDQQRTLQQLNEKLEALKAIERSMTTRPGAPASATTPGAASAANAASAPAAPKAP